LVTILITIAHTGQLCDDFHFAISAFAISWIIYPDSFHET